MTNQYTHITHKDIPIFIDKESNVLILGSLPSVKSREYGFYLLPAEDPILILLGHRVSHQE